MNHNIKGTSLTVTEELRGYVDKKLAGADKFVGDDSTAHADVELEYAEARAGDKYRAEFTVSLGGQVYRAEAWGSTMHEAIDVSSNHMVQEVRRSKKKRLALVRRGGAAIKDAIRGLRDRF